MDHTELIHATMKVADDCDCTLMRNETVVRMGANEQRFKGGLGVGSADLIGMTYEGRYIAVECKVGKDTPKKHQGTWLRAVMFNRGVAYVVRPDTLEAFRATLNAERWSLEDQREDLLQDIPLSGKKFEYAIGAYHNARLSLNVWPTKA